eukprot:TRINITY_DN72554_c0_g1_i1.p1 TRINITY_DN72554_c0_g1~~TRINITY_DN72554_c0_g1_i1.p1  ORF type:complete len:244 (+),score=40.31 TRINITY_DN72554_c0_g1_i1:130-861(+)
MGTVVSRCPVRNGAHKQKAEKEKLDDVHSKACDTRECKKNSSSLWPWIHAVKDIKNLCSGCVELPVEICPHLYLGDKQSARQIGILRKLNITHVLNMAGPEGESRDILYRALDITYCRLDAEDEEGYALVEKHFVKARDFIDGARCSGGACLVHCVAGINRSGLIAVAEYMLHEHQPVLKALAHCRRLRGDALLGNRSFQRQLVELADAHGLLGERPEGYSDEAPPPVAPPPRAASALDRLVR